MDTAAPALCPKHPHVNATLTCARCGTFACESCSSPPGKGLCADCWNRFASGYLDVGDILKQSFRLLLLHPKALAAVAAAYVVFDLVFLPLTHSTMMGGSWHTVPRELYDTRDWLVALAWLIYMLAGTALAAVCYALYIRFLGDVLTGHERSLGETLREGLGRVSPMFGLQLCLTVAVGVGFLLCLAPGVFLTVALSLATPAVVLRPAGPFEAMSFSWERTKGYRGSIFLVVLLSGLIFVGLVMFGGILTIIAKRVGSVGVMVVNTVLVQSITAVGFTLLLSSLVICYLRVSGEGRPASQSR